jgi:hypothetical protein
LRPANATLTSLAAALTLVGCFYSGTPGPLAAACAAATPISVGAVETGTLLATAGVLNPSCRFNRADRPFHEKIFTYTAATSGLRTASTDFGDATNVDTILHLLPACSVTAAELGCAEDVSNADPPATNLHSVLQFDAVAGTTYYIVLQASSGTLWNDPVDVANLPYVFELHLD